jgi:hypothetical protein
MNHVVVKLDQLVKQHTYLKYMKVSKSPVQHQAAEIEILRTWTEEFLIVAIPASHVQPVMAKNALDARG